MLRRSPQSLYWLALSTTGVLLCLPVLFVRYAPLVDYPNHLARAYILFHYKDVPTFQERYLRLFEPIPNVASDLVLFALQNVFDILTAGKIFLVLTIIIFVAGCHLLGKAAHGGRPSWLAVPCAFFVYNSAFLYGFVNYVLGVGVFCIALAYWFEWRERWTAKRLVLASALVFVAYLTHLSAYVFLGASFVVTELWHLRAERKSLRPALLGLIPLAPSLLAFVVFMRGSGQVGQLEWNTVGGKLIGTLALFLSYNYKLDLIFIAGALVIAGLLFVKKREGSGVVWPLFITGLLFAVLFLLSPKTLFTASGADVRFVLPSVLLLLLSLRVEVPLKLGTILLVAFLALASLRVGAIWRTWTMLDKQMGAEVERLASLPEGAIVYPLFVASEERGRNKLERSFEHAIHYATVSRRALVPNLFAIRGQQPLVFRHQPNFAALSNAESNLWLRYLSEYDYVWSYGVEASVKETLAARCSLVSERNGFALWKIMK